MINQQTKDLINKLAELRIKEKEIAAEIKAIVAEVTPTVSDLDSGAQLEVESGTFTIQKRRVWTYPAYVNMAEDVFKEAKEKAQATGDAEYTENTSLVFKANE